MVVMLVDGMWHLSGSVLDADGDNMMMLITTMINHDGDGFGNRAEEQCNITSHASLFAPRAPRRSSG